MLLINYIYIGYILFSLNIISLIANIISLVLINKFYLLINMHITIKLLLICLLFGILML